MPPGRWQPAHFSRDDRRDVAGEAGRGGGRDAGSRAMRQRCERDGERERRRRQRSRSGSVYACWASYVPQSSRRTPQISPTVQRARTPRASAAGGWRPDSATSRTSASADAARSASRSARTPSGAFALAPLDPGSTWRSSTGSAPSSVKRFTPTTTRSPDSTSLWYRKADASISAWTKPCSIAATAPPRSSIRAISSRARALELVGQRLDEVGARRAGPRCRSSLPRRRGSAASAARSSRRAPVGSASASSKEFVCRDCAPPQTAESAWIATRTMLFSGCCAVSVEPPVCAWKRSACARGFVAPKRSRMISAHRRRAARNFATSWKKWLCALKKKERRVAERVGRQPCGDRRLAVGDAVRERERELLRGARSRLADVVPGDRDRVPARQPLGAVREEVGREPHRRSRREDVVAARDVLLQHVVLHGAAQLLARDALALGDELVEEEEQCGRRVDRHRGRDLVERDSVEQRLHVAERVDRDARAADLALCERVVGVVAELRREVERDREAGLPALEQVAEARVRLLRRAVARVLADRPRTAAVHRLVGPRVNGNSPGRLELAPAAGRPPCRRA